MNQPKHNSLNSTLCPEDGVCTFEVFTNKTLNIKTDGIGALYPELLDGKKTVIKFEYKRHEIPNTVDGGYSEIIYAEIDPNIKELSLENETLIQAKVLYGRLCFCRGETGYFYVNEGVLNISSHTDGSKTYKLDFKVYEVPQVLTSIKERS
ncbi:hypothetical protein [Xanthomarina sp.]|uniref:hypothetical protein n=1 Tax=Xanthomarina sp. TaxID=1931211 RepID=UPI002CB61749|nr:hypothetical protein [Xanthomarina sp.]HLV40025.1 hypothetical protein [Xanthomarina sp.]